MKRVVIWGPGMKFTSGISYYTQRLGQALRLDTLTAHVYYALFNDMLPRRLFPGKAHVGEIRKRPNMPYCDINWWNPFSLWHAIKVSKNATAVIFEWWTGAVGLQYVIAALLLRDRNVILEYHEFTDTNEKGLVACYSRLMLWVLARLVRQGVFHSEWEAEAVPRHFQPASVHVIPHGVYDVFGGELPPKPVPASQFNVLFFGLVRDYKGLRYLIEAFHANPSPHWRLQIVGEEWDPVELPNDDRITRVPVYVDDTEVSRLFASAHVLVLPYTRASQSGVGHIAVQFGIPIVATRVGGLVESLRSYAGTVFVDPGRPEMIETALRLIHNSYDRWYPSPVPPTMDWKIIAQMWNEII